MTESIYQKHRPGNADDLYLKLKDGDAVKMRIVSEPAIVLFKEGQRPRYAWVVINHNAKKAQVYNAGVSVYSQIADLAEEWGDPKDFDITIKRKGAGQFDTEYSVTPLRDPIDVDKNLLAEADKIDLLNATKGKWLEDYNKDGELPDPVSNEAEEEKPPQDEIAEVNEDEPVDLSDIPF